MRFHVILVFAYPNVSRFVTKDWNMHGVAALAPLTGGMAGYMLLWRALAVH